MFPSIKFETIEIHFRNINKDRFTNFLYKLLKYMLIDVTHKTLPNAKCGFAK